MLTAATTPTSRRRAALAILFPALLAAAGWSAAAPSHRIALAPESKIWFDGTSTVRRFTCQATRVDGAIVVDEAAAAQLPGFAAAVQEGELTIPVETLDCRNGTMNEHMRKALRASEQPTITYQQTSLALAPGADGTFSATIKGRLTIAGKTNEIDLTGVATQQPDGSMILKGSKQLNMTDYGVNPPKLMLGRIKVHEPVTVGYEIVVKP